MKALSCLLYATSMVFLSAPLSAQNPGFWEGQQILWFDRIAGKWETGTYMRATPGEEQPIIQRKPGDPNSELAYAWDKIKAANTVPQQPIPAAGGAGKFEPGQKIWYRVGTSWPPKWEQGTFVGETPGGTQPIIRRKPDEFHPAGAQSAYSWEDVKSGSPGAGPGAGPMPPPNPGNGRPPTLEPGPGAQAAAGPPLTEEEVLSFLRDRVGDNPFADAAKLQQAKNDLAALIKKRGTAFRHDSSISPLGQKLTAFGYTSDISGPLGKNFGPPNAQNWLFGTFVTAKTGLPVSYRDGAALMRWNEVGALDTGSVTINPDGTYIWNTASAQGLIRGKWHAASPEESGDHGGAGVILEKAKNGANWHAYKYRAGNPQEEWLGLDNLPERSIREGAMRVLIN